MEFTGRTGRRILLFSLLGLIVPMVYFPAQFGTSLVRPSLINAFYEMVFYGFVIYLFYRRITLLHLFQACGACLVYRFILGVSFGVLISIAYGLDLQVAVTMGMSSYLPAIVLHVLISPFVLRPTLTQIYLPDRARRRAVPRRPQTLPTDASSGLTSIAISKDRGVNRQAPLKMAAFPDSAQVPETEPLSPVQADANGFERAVKYIGEHGAVELVCVVDHEGLLLSSFHRGKIVPEDWAPLSLLLTGCTMEVLARGELDAPEKVDLMLPDKRVVVACRDGFNVMVLAERQSDDLLHIRISQAMDMIGKFVAERYSEQAEAEMEKTHV